MKPQCSTILPMPMMAIFTLALIFSGCEKPTFHNTDSEQRINTHRLDIGFDELIKNAEIDVTITSRSHGYVAEARGRGTIPGGEYAGQRFQIVMEANYSDIGMETLVSGEAVVTIRSDRFESVMDTMLQSFCCGEGHLEVVDGEYVFTMYGQVTHNIPGGPHNHLFAGLGTTAGTMNMNIADQTGSVVEQSVPPHDLGIGLILDIIANYVRVDLH